MNRDEHEQTIVANWNDLELPVGQTMKVRDLWAHKELGEFADTFSMSVQPHQCAMLLVRP